jgi:hypothetical protein
MKKTKLEEMVVGKIYRRIQRTPLQALIKFKSFLLCSKPKYDNFEECWNFKVLDSDGIKEQICYSENALFEDLT